jgi:hypothetical protein
MPSRVDEIKRAIEKLSDAERAEVARFLNGWGDDAWDEQMKADAKAGRLDKLIAEVDADIGAGDLLDFP